MRLASILIIFAFLCLIGVAMMSYGYLYKNDQVAYWGVLLSVTISMVTLIFVIISSIIIVHRPTVGGMKH